MARTPRRSTSRRSIKQPSTARGRAGAARGNALAAVMIEGNRFIACMKQYGISGVERVAGIFGEITQGLVGPAAFTGNVVGTSPAAIPRTGSRTGGRAAAGELTAPQNLLLNSLNTNDTPQTQAQIAQRCGMAPANCARTLKSLCQKGYLQKQGRGKSAQYWKPAAPLQMTG